MAKLAIDALKMGEVVPRLRALEPQPCSIMDYEAMDPDTLAWDVWRQLDAFELEWIISSVLPQDPERYETAYDLHMERARALAAAAYDVFVAAQGESERYWDRASEDYSPEHPLEVALRSARSAHTKASAQESFASERFDSMWDRRARGRATFRRVAVAFLEITQQDEGVGPVDPPSRPEAHDDLPF